MLQIAVPLGTEYYDENKEEFIYPKVQILQLEHSLVSLSKWESKWHKPFLSKERMSDEETTDYIKCMTLTQNVPPMVYGYLTSENIQEVTDYINDPMTATTFSEDKNGKPNREIVTAEIIDYWMISLNIPFECRKWHLNKLLALIKVCTIKNSPQKKMSQKEAMSQQRALNAARRKKLGTRG
jgi:hypothetical protein